MSLLWSAGSSSLSQLDRALDALLAERTAAATVDNASTVAALDGTALRRAIGVVTSVDHVAETCCVRWLREGATHDQRVLEADVPTLSIAAHPQYSELRLDDVVCLMPGHPLLTTGVGMLATASQL